MGGEVLRPQLPPIRVVYNPVGFLEGNERADYVLKEGHHHGASLPRRLRVYETWVLSVRPFGASGGEGLHPGRFTDQHAEVEYDPGAIAEATRLPRGLRGRCVPGPAGPLRRAEVGGGLDSFHPAWKGSGSQVCLASEMK